MPRNRKPKKKMPPFEDVENTAPSLRILRAGILEFGSFKICTSIVWRKRDFGRNLPDRWEWEISLYKGKGTESRSWAFPYEQWDIVDRFRKALYSTIQLGVYEFIRDTGLVLEEEEEWWPRLKEGIE